MSDLSSSADELRSRFTGLLLGQAVGDALGLPWEGLSRRRAVKMFSTPDRYRFLFGRGMISDDTEHACPGTSRIPGRFHTICSFPGLETEVVAGMFAGRDRLCHAAGDNETLGGSFAICEWRVFSRQWSGHARSRSGGFLPGGSGSAASICQSVHQTDPH